MTVIIPTSFSNYEAKNMIAALERAGMTYARVAQ